MAEILEIRINDQPVKVAPGTLVATALAQAGVRHFHRSPQGAPRAPLCGMGVCFECRVTINGKAHCRSCLAVCEGGMEVRTDE